MKFNSKMSFLVSLLILAVIILSNVTFNHAATYSITVDGTNKQEVKYWGVNCWTDNPDHGIIYNNATGCLDAIYGPQMGTNLYRLDYYLTRTDPTHEWYTPGYDNMLVTHIQAAVSRGCHWVFSSWGPPKEMKTINNYFGSANGSDNFLKSGYEDDYAQWIVNKVQWFISQGCPAPLNVALQNEPDWGSWGYDGCRLYHDQIIIMTKELRNRLNTAGLQNVLVNVSDNALYAYNNWDPPHRGTVMMAGLNSGGDIETDSTYRNAVGVISAHSYCYNNAVCDSSPMIMQLFYDATHTTYTSNKERWMTEWEPIKYNSGAAAVYNADTDWKVMRQYIRHFNVDMSSLEFHAWIPWNVYAKTWSTTSIAFVYGTGATANRTNVGYIFQKIWQNAPASQGFYMRRVTTTDPDLKGESKTNYFQDFSAFTNGQTMVLTVVNPTTSTKVLDLNGLVGTSATMWYYTKSDAGLNNNPMHLSSAINNTPISNGRLSNVSFQPESINIIVTSNGAAPTPTASVTPTTTPTSSVPVTPTVTPTAIVTPTSAIITVNDATVGTGVNQYEYAGTWNTSTGTGKYNGDDHYSSTTNSYYQVDFNGTQIKLYGAQASHHGIAAVSIDGGTEVDVDFYAATRAEDVPLWTSPILTAANHTLKVRVKGTKNASSTGYVITADRVDITTETAATPTATVSPTATPTATITTTIPATATISPPATATVTATVSIIATPTVTVTPTATATSSTAFVKGVNINGTAVTIEGNNWLSYTDAKNNGLSTTTVNNASTSITPNPAVDSATNSMLNTAIWYGGNFTVSQTIANGSYQVYLWVMENYQSNMRSFNVKMEGTQVATGIGSLALGGWMKYGPYNVTVGDGTLNIEFVKVTSDPHVMGIAIFNAGAVATSTATLTPTATATPTATPTSSVIITPTVTPSATATASVVATATVTPTATATSSSGTALTIYGDALASGWSNSSWWTTTNYSNTSPVQAGSKSVAATYTQGWGALGMSTSSPVGASGYTAIKFWVHGGSGSNKACACFIRQTSGGTDSAKVGFTATAGVWNEITVSLSALGNPSQIGQICLQEYSGAAQTVIYYDEIRMVK